ncbi:hypothetical protein [Paractinoplanes toevensis]|uniref:Integral membrane protein n=1 Tax=Paractinoplanes toevensis TaxID=571911 RepID=A0A920BPA3_9ACTN|nr:hypothetical protein [Actinoplanes toevensis]GIM96627.1 hypothetical protein Ato02nite_084200 [Actinoplanes toevensis]
MTGYVRTESAEWTELRVHGVSGTPPESMLEQLGVRRVSGDASSGFYRRVWPAESAAGDNGTDTLEAYSWGGLTSGAKLRALWLLLIPFLLVNVAFYARPADRRGALKTFGELVQRLFALTITGTLVMALVNVSMDFGGWQCGDSCHTGWLGFLSWSWLDGPDRRIAVLALLPLAVIGVLWRLAQRSWCDNEATPVPEADPVGQVSLLENRHMWNSARPVRRLRAVHVSVALCLVGIFALAPFARDWPSLHAGTAVSGPKLGAEILLALTLLLAAVSLVLAGLPSMSDRPGAEDPTAGTGPTVADTAADRWRSRLIGALPWGVLVVVVTSLIWIFFARPAVTGSPGDPRTVLPWLSYAINVSIVSQAVLLIVMVGVLLAMRPKQPDRATPPAWGGFATVVLMLFGSALSGTYAAAMVLAVAHLIGKPQPRQQGIDPLVTSLPYFWAAALAVPVAVAALVFGLLAFWRLRRSARTTLLPSVTATYVDSRPGREAPPKVREAAAARATAISRTWATATLDDTVRRFTGWFVGVTIVLIAGAFVWFLADRTTITDASFPRALANVGDWLVGLFAAGLLYVGRQTYQNANTRRLVGVIWDLGTFWPRAAHPLAPPCYAERAVPELINRVGFLTSTGRVILSCHSQGAVIGAAVVNQLTYAQSGRVAFLTYGAPLRRLYARFFPAYFGSPVLARTAGLLLCGRADPDHEIVPWRNLFRRSDPIGGGVFGDDATDRVDELLVDPAFAKPPGDIAYPPTLGHSHYPDDPGWPDAVARVKELRLR